MWKAFWIGQMSGIYAVRTNHRSDNVGSQTQYDGSVDTNITTHLEGRSESVTSPILCQRARYSKLIVSWFHLHCMCKAAKNSIIVSGNLVTLHIWIRIPAHQPLNTQRYIMNILTHHSLGCFFSIVLSILYDVPARLRSDNAFDSHLLLICWPAWDPPVHCPTNVFIRCSQPARPIHTPILIDIHLLARVAPYSSYPFWPRPVFLPSLPSIYFQILYISLPWTLHRHSIPYIPSIPSKPSTSSIRLHTPSLLSKHYRP